MNRGVVGNAATLWASACAEKLSMGLPWLTAWPMERYRCCDVVSR